LNYSTLENHKTSPAEARQGGKMVFIPFEIKKYYCEKCAKDFSYAVTENQKTIKCPHCGGTHCKEILPGIFTGEIPRREYSLK
jgi:Zn finger protein HypA/HybF involved in hydrogenase expression